MTISSAKGITLIELVIAIALGVMILLAMYTIFASAFRFQAETQRADIVRSDVVLSLKALMRDLEAASWIENPAAPCNNLCDGSAGNASSSQSSDSLTGHVNFDRVLFLNTGDGRLDAGRPAYMFHYCVNANRLCRVQGAAGSAAPGGNCCDDAGAVIVAERIQRDGGQPYFTRPAYTNNQVEIHFIARQDIPNRPEGVQAIVNTAITSRASRTAGP